MASNQAALHVSRTSILAHANLCLLILFAASQVFAVPWKASECELLATYEVQVCMAF